MAKHKPPVAFSWNVLVDIFANHPAVAQSPVLVDIIRDAYFCGAAMAVLNERRQATKRRRAN